MTYRDIILNNRTNNSPVSWWPRYAYHYTNVSNAISILTSGYLFSRSYAAKHNLIRTDSASRQVIDMTKTETLSFVRFYFRPLTPTQYYNEGYKHPLLRYYKDTKANMPVPVFFVFNLEKLLMTPGVQFSDTSQAGGGAPMSSGLEAFSQLDFKKIYSDGPCDRDTIKYRHAEILHPNAYAINDSLEAVLCRNAVEQTTLLTLLREKSAKAFYEYKDKIKVCKAKMFENNGLFVTGCQYHNSTIGISFSETNAKANYTAHQKERNEVDHLSPIQLTIVLTWKNTRSPNLKTISMKTDLDYESPQKIVLEQLPRVSGAKTIRIQVSFDDEIMCCMEQSLTDMELIR